MVATLKQEPTLLDISITVDDDFSWTAFFEEELTPNVFTPKTLTGVLIEAMIKKKEKDDVALDQFTLDPDNPSTGYLVLSLTDAQTKALGAGTFYYSVRFTEGGYTQTYLAGKFTLTRRATYD